MAIRWRQGSKKYTKGHILEEIFFYRQLIVMKMEGIHISPLVVVLIESSGFDHPAPSLSLVLRWDILNELHHSDYFSVITCTQVKHFKYSSPVKWNLQLGKFFKLYNGSSLIWKHRI